MIVLVGSLTAATETVFRSIILPVIDKESFILNMESVTMVSTAGLSSLVDLSIASKQNGKRIVILWPDKDLLQLAETMGVYHYLVFAKNIDEAKLKIRFFL